MWYLSFPSSNLNTRNNISCGCCVYRYPQVIPKTLNVYYVTTNYNKQQVIDTIKMDMLMRGIWLPDLLGYFDNTICWLCILRNQTISWWVLRGDYIYDTNPIIKQRSLN